MKRLDAWSNYKLTLGLAACSALLTIISVIDGNGDVGWRTWILALATGMALVVAARERREGPLRPDDDAQGKGEPRRTSPPTGDAGTRAE